MIGTTGFSQEQIKKIKMAAQHAIIIRAGNMSLGVNLLVQLTKQVSAVLDKQYDIEILEMHHNKKIDAPSGTALMLGEAAAKGRGITLRTLKTPFLIRRASKGKIGFASQRYTLLRAHVIFSVLMNVGFETCGHNRMVCSWSRKGTCRL